MKDLNQNKRRGQFKRRVCLKGLKKIGIQILIILVIMVLVTIKK